MNNDQLHKIGDFLPTLKLTYNNRLVHIGTVWGMLKSVEFERTGKYLGCLYSFTKSMEFMFVIQRKKDKLYVEEVFGRFEP